MNKPISEVFLMQNLVLNPMVSLIEQKNSKKWAKKPKKMPKNKKNAKKRKSIG